VKSVTISFIAFWSCYAGTSLCVLFGREEHGGGDARKLALAIRLGYMITTLAAGIVLYCISRKRRKGLKGLGASRAFSNSIAGIVFLGFVGSSITNSYSDPTGSEFWDVFEAFFFATFLMHLCRIHLQGMVPAVLCFTVFAVLGAKLAISGETELLMESFIYVLIIFGTQLLAMQGDPRRSRKDHNKIADEHKRVNSLLDSMLPYEVLMEMKNGKLSLAYEYEDVSFLFADIVGFTKFCASHSAEQAVNLVTRLFADFDEQTVNLGVYKVCTIGDAYLVVNEPRTQQLDVTGDCEKVFQMAKRMLQIIVRVREQVNHKDLDMRVGLHCGKFIGGVIGTKRLRFDFWGEDVMIGNSIESNGRAGMICVSERAKEMLERCNVGQLTYFFNKDITLKNKRVVKSYMCTRTDGQSFSKQDPPNSGAPQRPH
jgi:class 3 adenylate cyclase